MDSGFANQADGKPAFAKTIRHIADGVSSQCNDQPCFFDSNQIEYQIELKTNIGKLR